MPAYKVLDGHILHDETLYAPGDLINLTEEQAEGLRVELLPENEQSKANLTCNELRDMLTQRGVEIPPKATKPKLLELLAASEPGAKDPE